MNRSKEIPLAGDRLVRGYRDEFAELDWNRSVRIVLDLLFRSVFHEGDNTYQ